MSCNLNTGKEVNFSPFPHFEVTKFKTQQWYMVLEKKWPPKGNLMQKKKIIYTNQNKVGMISSLAQQVVSKQRRNEVLWKTPSRGTEYIYLCKYSFLYRNATEKGVVFLIKRFSNLYNFEVTS